MKRRKINKEPYIITMIFCLAVTLPEIYYTYLYINEQIEINTLIYIYFAASGLLILSSIILHRIYESVNFLLFLTIFHLATFIFGAIAVTVAFILYVIVPKNDDYSWLLSESTKKDLLLGEELYIESVNNPHIFKNLENYVPFSDVAIYGTVDQKRILLEKINKNFDRNFAPMLFKFLNEDNIFIRTMSASIIDKYERKYLQKIIEYYEIYQEKPDDKKNHEKLIDAYDDYGTCNLLDRKTEKLFLELAIQSFEDYAKKYPEDKEVNYKLARLYIRNKELDKGYNLIKQFKNGKFHQKMWYMQCLYLLNKYDELREYCKKVDKDTTDDEKYFDYKGIISLWSKGIIK